jgi:predicted O-linked N-acetylglucosamine transferase (SPINDLY family)
MDEIDKLINKANKELENSNYDCAEILLKQALKKNPINTKTNELLAYVYANTEKKEEAFKHLSIACKDANCTATALYYYSIYQINLELYSEAIQSIHESIKKVGGEYIEALVNLGFIYSKIGKKEIALLNYQKAVSLNPNQSELHFNVGRELQDLERYDESLRAYDNAINLNNNYSEALLNQGIVLKKIKQLDKAIDSIQKAVELNPLLPEAQSSLGHTLVELKRHEEALVCFDRAISAQPNYAEAWSNKGHTLVELKRHEEALVCFRKTKEIKPEYPYMNGYIVHTKMQMCLWDEYCQDKKNITEGIKSELREITPFAYLAITEDPEKLKKSSEIFFNDKYQIEQNLIKKVLNNKKEKIRIGYYSADFRDHPVSFLTAELFENHDKNIFEIYAFSYGQDDKGDYRKRIENAFDKFIDVQFMDGKKISQLSRTLEIDIAVDLGGYTANSKMEIFSYRAAPIQVSYLGFLGTLSHDQIDYLISDKIIIPEELKKYYKEKIVYLPSYQVNDRKKEVPSNFFLRQELGISDDAFVFCNFNNNFKITPKIFSLWMEILKETENSILYLYADTPSVIINLQNEVVKRGIETNRIIFGGKLIQKEYLGRYLVCDLFLDTFPYNGGATTSDALWAGLPVITLQGRSFASRYGSSLLTAIGHPELITKNLQEYKNLAIRLAKNKNEIKKIQISLKEKILSSELFNSILFTKNLEKAYKHMYKNYYSGLSPIDIYIQED